MRKILFISTIFLMLVSLETFAQRGDADQEGSKEENQKPNKGKREEALTQYAELARTRKWAIIIKQVNVSRYNTSDLIDVDPKLNFITVKVEDITTQLNFDYNISKRIGESRNDRVESTDFGNIEDYIIKLSKNSVLINVRYKNIAEGGEDRKQIVIGSAGWARTEFETRYGRYTIAGQLIPLDQAYIHLTGVKIK